VFNVDMQDVPETRNDQNVASELVLSGRVTSEAALKRKAEMDYLDDQLPVKKMKSGKIYHSCFCWICRLIVIVNRHRKFAWY